MVQEPKSLSLSSAKERIYVRSLTLKDLDACVSVENQAFVPEERCSRKQFKCLLSTCPSVSLGIFTTSPFPFGPEVLLGHAIASKITSPFITESCYSSSHHSESGPTIALHSLAIVPTYQRRTLGTTLLSEFIRRSAAADRIAIIAREKLVRFYERFGFVCYGMSTVGFGGGGWRDLVLDFEKERGYARGVYEPISPSSCGFMESIRSTPLISDRGM